MNSLIEFTILFIDENDFSVCQTLKWQYPPKITDIFGGSNVVPGGFPHMVSLEYVSWFISFLQKMSKILFCMNTDSLWEEKFLILIKLQFFTQS